jgi:hypothetical protein
VTHGFPSLDVLEAGFSASGPSPTDRGRLELIVRRPRSNEREVLAEAELDVAAGLVGDWWSVRHSARGGPSARDTQLTLINARVLALVAQHSDRWPLAGDQLVADLDLSCENLPPGSQLAIGAAVIEVSAVPHTGCRKFAQRFGADAVAFVNSTRGRTLRLRGLNARVVRAGLIRVGDPITKLPVRSS